MIAAIIVTVCILCSALLYICALQLGYLMGKKAGRKDLEDKYWNANMLIAQYSDNHSEKLIANINVDGSEISRGIYEKITGKKVDDLSDLGDPYEDGGL